MQTVFECVSEEKKMNGPHIPMTSVAGHFMGMQPSDEASREKVWYRGDEFKRTCTARDRYKLALMGVMEILDDPTPLSDADMLVEILDIVQKALE
jgi:hypothetical protein